MSTSEGLQAEDRRRHVEQQATRRSGGILRDCIDFLVHTRKWWMVPILVVLLLLGLVIIVGGSSLAPLIYTLF
jgi:hypothetical protein